MSCTSLQPSVLGKLFSCCGFLLGARKEQRTAPNLILLGKIVPVTLHSGREAGKHQISTPSLPCVPSLTCSSCSLPCFVPSGHPRAAQIQDSAPKTSNSICRAPQPPQAPHRPLPCLTSHPWALVAMPGPSLATVLGCSCAQRCARRLWHCQR